VGVAASLTPGAETAARGEDYGLLHSREWWALCLASTVLTLTCYGAVLRQQLALLAGERPQLLQSLREALRDVPSVLVLAVFWMLPFTPAIVSTALRGPDVVALLLAAAALAVLVYALPAWPALIATGGNPLAAMRGSIALARGRWLEFAGVVAVLLLGMLVFGLLAGILIGMVMELAGLGITPTSGRLAFWLNTVVLAAPVVYAGAVAVVTWRAVARTSWRSIQP
jgi:hypothetical protein